MDNSDGSGIGKRGAQKGALFQEQNPVNENLQ